MNAVQRLRATYDMKPVDHLVRREFYIWQEALERWKGEGMPPDADMGELFGFDPPAEFALGHLGWCEPAFVPPIEDRVLEETAEYQIVRDSAGRTVKFFRGRRHGFMPTYLKHAVADDRDWEEEVAPRLSPQTPQRWDGFDEHLARAAEADAEGKRIVLNGVGGYMYLRALVGPEEICYLLVDNPALVHKMMQAWLALFDAVAERAQRRVEIDTVYLAEDICYNHGLLISPDMVREFLFPYYQQVLANIRRRQKTKRLVFQLDTDGNCAEAAELYRQIGLDALTPLEVAAGCDVLEYARKYPDLVLLGGIDKRVLAAGKKQIDAHLKRILPPMVRRGGYIPTCDHGVPDNVSYENYVHYRRRMLEWDH